MTWPPRNTYELEHWLIEDMPLLRAQLAARQERLDAAEAQLHQPVTARLSQVQIARTSTSDPTFDVVRNWVVQIPSLRAEIAGLRGILGQYEAAKLALAPEQQSMIALRYEQQFSRERVMDEVGISPRTYDRWKQESLQRMLGVVLDAAV